MKPKTKSKTPEKALETMTKAEILRRRTALETQEYNQRMAWIDDHFKNHFKLLKGLQDECTKLGHDFKKQVTLNSDGFVCTNCKFVKERETEQ